MDVDYKAGGVWWKGLVEVDNKVGGVVKKVDRVLITRLVEFDYKVGRVWL